MTVSLTKEEVGWLFACLNIATQDTDEELDKELLDTVKRIKEKTKDGSSERNIETKMKKG